MTNGASSSRWLRSNRLVSYAGAVTSFYIQLSQACIGTLLHRRTKETALWKQPLVVV